MVNLFKYIGEKNGTFESPRYSRGFVIAELVITEFHCMIMTITTSYDVYICQQLLLCVSTE